MATERKILISKISKIRFETTIQSKFSIDFTSITTVFSFKFECQKWYSIDGHYSDKDGWAWISQREAEAKSTYFQTE